MTFKTILKLNKKSSPTPIGELQTNSYCDSIIQWIATIVNAVILKTVRTNTVAMTNIMVLSFEDGQPVIMAS